MTRHPGPLPLVLVAAAIALAILVAPAQTAPRPPGEHLVLVPSEARHDLDALPVTRIASYDAFDLVEADGAEVDRLLRAGAVVRDDMRRVTIGGRDVDPLTQRPPLVTKTGSTVAADDEALALIQFVGPIKDEWRAALEKTGVRVVWYVAQNAYLVHGTGAQFERAATGEGVRAATPYTADDKLAVATGPGEMSLGVSTLTGGDGAAARAELAAAGPATRSATATGGVATRFVRIAGPEADRIAADPGVVAVEPAPVFRLHDERSSSILAGTIDGAFAPRPPVGADAYGPKLEALGFGSGGITDFLVNITDSGVDTAGISPPPAGHPDFRAEGNPVNDSRLVFSQEATAGDADARDCVGHGTHVASTIGGFNAGTGSSPDSSAVEDAQGFNYGLGVAHRARLAATKIFQCNGAFSVETSFAALADNAYANDVRVTNNSWGNANSRGAYNADARAYDAIVRDARSGVPGNQENVQVFSAGNDGVPNTTTTDGYGTITAPGTAKNVITVGASESVRSTAANCWPDSAANSARDIAPFSSRGPAADGRTKPDVVAPGTHIISAKPQHAGFTGASVCNSFPAGSTLYTQSDGTSMAAPQVTGAAALTRDWYRRTHGGGTTPPSPAMTKALLANTTTDLVGGNEGLGAPTNPNVPARSQGWGRANIGNLFDAAAVRAVRDQNDVVGASGESTVRTFTVSDPAEPVKVSLAWSDAPGPVGGPAPVNDLDLTVDRGGNTFLGNQLASGVSVAGGAADTRNNLENVFLSPSGGTISVAVTGTNVAGDGLPGNADTTDQDYALVVSNATQTGDDPTVILSGAPAADGGDGDGSFEPGERVNINPRARNKSGSTVNGATASIGGGLIPVNGPVEYPPLGGGASADPNQLVVGRVPRSAACGTTANATVALDVAGQPQQTRHVNIAVGGLGPPATTSKTESPALPIADASLAGVTSTLQVPPGAGTIDDVDIRIDDLTHTFIGDLKLLLTSPTGTQVVLADRPGPGGSGSSRNNLTGVVFDDAAPTAIESVPSDNANMTPGSSFRPDQPLSVLNGENASGTWTLKVTDNAGGDTGQLGGWSVVKRGASCANPATATTGAPTNVTHNGADVTGQIGPGGALTDYRVDYGPTTAYGNSTPVAEAGDGTGSAPVTANLAALSPSTTYHYRVVALRDATVVAQGADAELTTSAAPASPDPGGGDPGPGGTTPGGDTTPSGTTPSGTTPSGQTETGGGSGGGTPPALGFVSFSGTPSAFTATSSRKFNFTFTGTPGGAGTVSFATTGPVAARKKRRLNLGTKSFTIGSNGKASVAVTLSKSNFAALKRLKKLKIGATVKLDGRDFTKTFTLKPPKPKKRR